MRTLRIKYNSRIQCKQTIAFPFFRKFCLLSRSMLCVISLSSLLKNKPWKWHMPAFLYAIFSPSNERSHENFSYPLLWCACSSVAEENPLRFFAFSEWYYCLSAPPLIVMYLLLYGNAGGCCLCTASQCHRYPWFMVTANSQ